MGWYEFQPYESVAQKKARAEREIQKFTKKGMKLRPVRIQGQKIATTFWGRSWCENIEHYSDFDNRLPRGRSYVRHGAVIHLDVEKGQITALVSGSSMYTVRVSLQAVKPDHWQKIKRECAGKIGSMIDLLQGKLSQAVMQVVTNRESGLFPKIKEIKFSCTCPDYAGMCKHVSAVLYAIGNRLDSEPEMLFSLRGLDHNELITEALPAVQSVSGEATTGAIATDELGDIFGIDIDISVPSLPVSKPNAKSKTTTSKPAKNVISSVQTVDTSAKRSVKQVKGSDRSPKRKASVTSAQSSSSASQAVSSKSSTSSSQPLKGKKKPIGTAHSKAVAATNPSKVKTTRPKSKAEIEPAKPLAKSANSKLPKKPAPSAVISSTSKHEPAAKAKSGATQSSEARSKTITKSKPRSTTAKVTTNSKPDPPARSQVTSRPASKPTSKASVPKRRKG